jgi:hypothetical protein
MTGSGCIGEFPVFIEPAFPDLTGLDPAICRGTVLIPKARASLVTT